MDNLFKYKRDIALIGNILTKKLNINPEIADFIEILIIEASKLDNLMSYMEYIVSLDLYQGNIY